jgi:hypothetical protein
MIRTTGSVPAGSRSGETIVNQDVGEEMHDCGYCGTRTIETTWSADGVEHRHCPHCQQRYRLHDDEDAPDLDNLGEIEVVDERTGEVTGMTTPRRTPVEKIKEGLARLRAEQSSKATIPEASQADLNHLFGIEPSPYGDKFGSF